MPGLPEGLQVQQAGHPVLTILCQLADKKSKNKINKSATKKTSTFQQQFFTIIT
jgi:hypothetical protein